MNVSTVRPILISIAQYLAELEAGTMNVLDLIEKARSFGVQGIELRPEPWPAYRSELVIVRERLQSLGMIVTYATRSWLFAVDADAQRALLADIDTAAALGAPLLRIFTGPVPPDDTDPAWEEALTSVEQAQGRDVVLALENFSGSPGGTVAEIRRVLDRIPSPSLGTTIDIGNYPAHGEDVPAAIRAVGHRAAYVHLKDGMLQEDGTGTYGDASTYLGGGTLELDDILGELDRLPNKVPYCFEFRGGGDPDGRIEKSLAYLRARQRAAGGARAS
jgi:sugar phosphate isomerase/epimerase